MLDAQQFLQPHIVPHRQQPIAAMTTDYYVTNCHGKWTHITGVTHTKGEITLCIVRIGQFVVKQFVVIFKQALND